MRSIRITVTLVPCPSRQLLTSAGRTSPVSTVARAAGRREMPAGAAVRSSCIEKMSIDCGWPSSSSSKSALVRSATGLPLPSWTTTLTSTSRVEARNVG